MPKPWKQTTMGELFTQEQAERICEIYNECKGDYDATVKALKPYFQSIRSHLEARQCDPDFLAYAVPFWIREAMNRQN